MKKMFAVSLMVLGMTSVSFASPFVNLTMLTSEGATSVDVQPGVDTVVNFQLVATFAPEGTTNSSGGMVPASMGVQNASAGLASMRFNIFQATTDPVQVSFESGVNLMNGFTDATGSRVGTLTDRGNGFSNLLSVAAVSGPGVYNNDAVQGVVLATGSFVVKSPEVGTSSTLQMSWLDDSAFPDCGLTSTKLAAGTFRMIDGAGVLKTVIRTSTSTVVDDVFGYSGLTVNVVPEPATIGLMLLGLGLLRRKH